MNRKNTLELYVYSLGGEIYQSYIRGPNNSFGKKGVVSYWMKTTGLNYAQKAVVCQLAMDNLKDVGLAYVTREGNINVEFTTRADGSAV